MRESILRANLYIGAALLLVSTCLLVMGFPWMKTWFYCFAWWPFLLILDSLNFRLARRSPLSRGLPALLFMAFMSIPFWLVFELFNLRLRNWSYFNLPAARAERWLGYSLSFATVIPALAELSFLLAALGVKGPKLPFLRFFARRPLLSALLGAAFLVLSLAWPFLFFPLVWLGFVFLVDPLNQRLGLPSFLAESLRSRYDRLWQWMLGGLAAGVAWEFFNFWAGTHWEYTLPYLDFWRIFQMPFFGFLGFIPFALEAFAFWTLIRFLWDRIAGRPLLRASVLVFTAAFDAGVFYLIDRFTLLTLLR